MKLPHGSLDEGPSSCAKTIDELEKISQKRHLHVICRALVHQVRAGVDFYQVWVKLAVEEHIATKHFEAVRATQPLTYLSDQLRYGTYTFCDRLSV